MEVAEDQANPVVADWVAQATRLFRAATRPSEGSVDGVVRVRAHCEDPTSTFRRASGPAGQASRLCYPYNAQTTRSERRLGGQLPFVNVLVADDSLADLDLFAGDEVGIAEGLIPALQKGINQLIQRLGIAFNGGEVFEDFHFHDNIEK